MQFEKAQTKLEASAGAGEDFWMYRKALLVLAATCSTASPVLAEIRVAVSYTFVETEVSPLQTTRRTNWTDHYTLEGNSEINTTAEGGLKASKLGQNRAILNKAGQVSEYKLSVRPGNRLVAIKNYPTYYFRTTIRTNGSDSCTAVREAILRPGHQYFEAVRISNHDRMYLSDMHFENVNCVISSD